MPLMARPSAAPLKTKFKARPRRRRLDGLLGREDKMEDDLSFLKEMKEKLEQAIERKDATLFEYVLQMLQDWIEELEASA